MGQDLSGGQRSGVSTWLHVNNSNNISEHNIRVEQLTTVLMSLFRFVDLFIDLLMFREPSSHSQTALAAGPNRV